MDALPRIDRRTFLGATAAAVAAPLAFARAAELELAAQKSEFAYISPLLASGKESTCHGEVWFSWLDGSVVMITGTDRWKARAVARGLDTARVWLGDYGRWKGMFSTNESFRRAPSFDAKVSVSKDAELLDRMLADFERKYPDEIADWRDRMRSGFADGSRTLLRYTP